jgi:hypothetical protein
MTRNRSLLLGVAIGLFGALAVLTARYVAVVLAGWGARWIAVPENSNNKWTPEEDALLKSLIEANTSIHLVAAKLKRSVGAIRARASMLNILMKWVRIGPKAKKWLRLLVGELKNTTSYARWRRLAKVLLR